MRKKWVPCLLILFFFAPSFQARGQDKVIVAKPIRVRMLCCFGILTSKILVDNFHSALKKEGYLSKEFNITNGAGLGIYGDKPTEVEMLKNLIDQDYVIIALDDKDIIDRYKNLAKELYSTEGRGAIIKRLLATSSPLDKIWAKKISAWKDPISVEVYGVREELITEKGSFTPFIDLLSQKYELTKAKKKSSFCLL